MCSSPGEINLPLLFNVMFQEILNAMLSLLTMRFVVLGVCSYGIRNDYKSLTSIEMIFYVVYGI